MAGRPPTPGRSAAAKAHAESERARYRALPKAKREAVVKNRDREAQRQADARRYERDRPKRQAKDRELDRKDRASGSHDQQRKARAVARVALATGRLKKPATCQRCGQRPPTQIHHSDYGKPLQVRFLCATCHGAMDRASSASERGRHA